MPGAVPRKRPHWHAPAKGTGPAFLLSLLAHTLLFVAIAFVVRWKTEPAGTLSAELWSGLPAAAPAPAPAPPPAPVVEPAPPPPKVEPTPEPEPVKKPDIVVEQKPEPKKVEPPKKIEPPKKAEPKKEPPKKTEPPKPDPKIEAQKREAARAAQEAEKRHEAEIARNLAAAAGGAPRVPSGATGVAGGAAGYDAQVVGCVRPHIVFNVPEGIRPKQFVAEFEVQLLPTGEQAGAPKLLKASGLAAYDQAVERAIRRCDPFPRPKEGAMPRSLRLTFDPVDTR